ncbi:MAG: hypothetical protein SNJ84_04300 [Verrucomicrobiia bacterium]
MKSARLQQRAPELAGALARGGFQKNLARRCAIAAITVGLLVTAAAGLGLADYQLVFPRWVRLAGGGVMLAALAAGLMWLWREWNLFSSARRVALHLERKHPELGCMLSTAVEYAESETSPPSDNPYERVLIARLMRAATRESSVARPDLWAEIRRALPIVAGAGLLGGLLLAYVPDLPIVLKRVVTPWEAVGYTLLDISPGTTDWAAGEPVLVEASFRGPVTTPPKITWKTGREPKRTAWMTRDGPSEFSFAFPATPDPIDYTIEVARLDPVSHRITPVEVPRLKHIETRITPPDYTNAPTLTTRHLSISLLTGSRVSISFELDRPMSSVALQFEDGEKLPMVQSRENTWLAHWFPPQTTTFRLAFTDSAGRTILSPRPYPIVVLPDHPPRLRWEPPFPDRALRTGRPVPLQLRITDDHGGIAARFFWKKAGEPPRASTLPIEEVQPGEWWASPILQIPEGAASPGDLILAWAEASDARHRTAETMARSRPLAFVTLPPLESIAQDPPPPNSPPDPSPSALPPPTESAPEILQSPWFDLAWVLHSGVFGISPSTTPEAFADLRAEITSLADMIRTWLTAWDQIDPTSHDRTQAVRNALDSLASAMNNHTTGRDEASAASESVLAAITRLLYRAPQDQIQAASATAQPNVLRQIADREREWLAAASRWSDLLKNTARQLSTLNQRIAGADRLADLRRKLNDSAQTVEELLTDMSALAKVNPLCSHQILRPVQAALNDLRRATQASDQGEPGQSARDSTRAVRNLMEAASRLDDEVDPARRLTPDGARDLPGDPMENILRLYFRRIHEGEASTTFDP